MASARDTSASVNPLARVVALRLDAVPLEAALRTVAAEAGVRLSYSSDLLPGDRRVSLVEPRITVGDALRTILRGTGLGVVTTPSGYVVLVSAPASRIDARADSAAGPRSLGVARVIDRVVVMGTPVAGAPERGLASAVTVLTAADIARFGIRRMDELFRAGGIPGVVVWDGGATSPLAQLGAVRGSSSFSANYLKTYVDGVEIASPQMLFAIDPRSVERIEVIRGPQGSALYGSDAINGVVQIVTKKGIFGAEWRPQVGATVSGGVQESRYVDGSSGVQDHALGIGSGGRAATYDVGGSFERAGPFVPGGRSTRASLFGGGQLVTGPLHIESSARHYELRYIEAPNPLLDGGLAPSLGSQRLTIRHDGVGVTTRHQISSAWHHTLVVGVDRHSGTIAAQPVPNSTPDILLGATDERSRRTSLRYNSTFRLPLGASSATSLTAGVEHSRLRRERLGERSILIGGDLTGNGPGLTPVYADSMRNTGYFAQWKLDVRNTLFLVAGTRAEVNDTFGEGQVWSPMIGAVAARDVGRSTVKLRVGYGKGIRPQKSTDRVAVATVASAQLANPALAPESQAGTEGGVELYVADRLALRATAYRQIADGLVQNVVQNTTAFGVNSRTTTQFQRQNVGRIANTGLELDGSFRGAIGAVDVQATGAFATSSSRVRRLTPFYSGDLRVGDQVPEIPTTSGEVAVSVHRAGAAATLGATYIGPWTGYDWLGYYAPPDGQRRGSLRDYWIRYPSLFKPRLALSARVLNDLSLFLTIDNLTNVQRNERDNLHISPGRTTTLGVRVR